MLANNLSNDKKADKTKSNIRGKNSNIIDTDDEIEILKDLDSVPNTRAEAIKKIKQMKKDYLKPLLKDFDKFMSKKINYF